MSEVFALPGYDVQALLGFGATGEVWRARELVTGDTVALKRLHNGAAPAAVDALRREAALLRTLDTPYVVRLRAVVGDVLVLDHAAGGSLAALLARRGALEPGEVVTVGGPLAQALAAAHARGLVHGDVTPANVLFTADGMPLLADLGVARVLGQRLARAHDTAEHVDPAVAAGGQPGAAADVWALAAVCHHMLAGAPPRPGDTAGQLLPAAAGGSRAPLGLLAPHAPRALVSAVEAGLAADPAARPDAAAFAGLLQRAHAATPVRLTGGPSAAGPVPAVRDTRAARPAAPGGAAAARRGVPRPVLAALAGAGLLVAGGAAGWVSGAGGQPTAPALPVAAATPDGAASAGGGLSAGGASTGGAMPNGGDAPVAAPDLAALLDDLDAARAAAFAAGDVTALADVYAPGSPGLAADSALLQRLVDRRQTAHGLRHDVMSVDVVEAGADAARLRVVDALAAYEVRDDGGRVVSRAPARGAQAFAVALARTPAGWRLVEIRPEPERPSG